MEQAAASIQKRMQALARREHTEVLEYAYDTQERGADAVTCVKLAELVAERRLGLGAAVGDAEAGRRLRADDATVEDFARNFPGIFKNSLDLAGAPRHLAMLKQLARIRQAVERREMSEAEANVHATRVILEKTAREPTAKEREEQVATQGQQQQQQPPQQPSQPSRPHTEGAPTRPDPPHG
jgi:hypothetical protein